MRKIREVLRLRWEHRVNVREIALSVGIGRTTVGEYLNRAKAAGLAWPLPEETRDEDLARLLFPPAQPKGEPPRPMPAWAEVDKELARKGVTLLLLWHEYKERFPDGYGYSRYASLYRAWHKASDLTMLQRHKAGERLFVDYAGLTMDLTDPKTGLVRTVPIYSAALGASQKIFAKACDSQNLPRWLKVNEEAFEFYGGVPQILVPDNLKTGVTSPDHFEPVLNPAFSEFARFYGVAIIPARSRKPRDKAKVENAVQQVERWVLAPLRNRTFFSLEELNEAIALQVTLVNNRTMKGPDASRDQLFEELDRPALRPLPQGRFSYAAWKRAKVAPDYHVEFEGHRYSVPFSFVGKHVELRITESTVEIFLGGKRICTHTRSLSRFGFTTEPSHRPSSHREHAEWTPERLENWALKTGPSTAGFVRAILEARAHPEQGFRACMGLLSLEKTYGKERLEAACARALRFRSTSYQNVKLMLEKGLDKEPLDAESEQRTLPLHQNVRGPGYFKEEAPCAN